MKTKQINKNINLGFKVPMTVTYDSFNNTETYSMKSIHLKLKIAPSINSVLFDLYLSENNTEYVCILRSCEKDFLKYIIRSIFKVTFKKHFI